MRGRLRVVGGDGGENTSWAEVPAEYWSLVAGDGAIPVIHQPSTPLLEFGLADLESMLNEVAIFLGKFCLWYCIPNTELDQGLLPIKDNDEVDSMIVLLCYSKCMNLYTTNNVIDYGADFGDFSMTQYEEDERVERIEHIREELVCLRNMELAARARPSWNGGDKFLVATTDGGHELKIDDERNKQEGETTAAAHRIVKWPIANNKAHEQQTSAGPSNPSAASKTNPPASSNASANSTVPSKTTTSHGGIIRPLKPPAAISRQNPLGVKPIPGQKFTSLKNLEAAKTKMQKNMGKKN
ncbi:hypothetical protein ACET3Z_032449 [Daucus carota]